LPHREHELGWPSVTEVLNDYNKNWMKWFYKKHGTVEAAEAYGKERAAVGTRIHEAFERLRCGASLEDAIVGVQDDEHQAIAALAKAMGQLDIVPVASELEVENKHDKYHGSLDGLDRINNPSMLPNEDFLGAPVLVESGVLTITDLKTKENDKPLSTDELRKHAMQLAAYGEALRRESGNGPELGLIIQLDIPTAKVTLHCVYPLARYYKPFKLQRDLWDYIKGKEEWEKTKKRKRKSE
jgi:hypothetical protein